MGEGYQFETTSSPAETLSMQDYRKVLEGYVNRLPLPQRDIIVRRFYEGQTLEKVADVYCMSAANADQIERKALGKLNKWIVAMHKRELSDFADLLVSQN